MSITIARLASSGTRWLLSLVVLAGLASFTAPGVHAQDHEDRCQRRIRQAEHDLHEAIEHHGRYSRQADHERRELREAREHCWRERQRWWDEHEHRWHDRRDWDDRDHDRD